MTIQGFDYQSILRPGEEVIRIIDNVEVDFRIADIAGDHHPYSLEAKLILTNWRFIVQWKAPGGGMQSRPTRLYSATVIYGISERLFADYTDTGIKPKEYWPYQAIVKFSGDNNIVVETELRNAEAASQLSAFLNQALETLRVR